MTAANCESGTQGDDESRVDRFPCLAVPAKITGTMLQSVALFLGRIVNESKDVPPTVPRLRPRILKEPEWLMFSEIIRFGWQGIGIGNGVVKSHKQPVAIHALHPSRKSAYTYGVRNQDRF